MEKKLLGQTKFQRRGSIQRDDDLVYIMDIFQDLHDVLEGWIFQFRIERRQHQRNRIGRGMPLQFLFQLIEIGRAETMQDRHEPVLMKIRHGASAQSSKGCNWV